MVVEIIGLAGSGKSTLAGALCNHDERIVAGRRFAPAALNNMPFFIRHLLWSLPPLVLQSCGGRRITGREVKRMITLQGWHGVLQRQAAGNDVAIILDQGPIFKLTNLHGFGPEWFRRQRFESWWNRMFRRWASVLDAVIWLDAPRDVLIERIHSRGTWHSLQGKSAAATEDFLSTYHKSSQHVISRLLTNNQFDVLRFDTSRQSSQQIADTALELLQLS